jgi:hypothetical protein
MNLRPGLAPARAARVALYEDQLAQTGIPRHLPRH